MSHFFPAHDQAIMSLLSILQKDRERCYFLPINRHCKSPDSFKRQWVHLLKRSVWNAPFPVIPTSPRPWQALGKGHILCSHSDKPYLSLSGSQGGEKRLFENGAPKGINRGINKVPLFIDPRLDSLITRCSLHFRLCVTSIYSCPGFGFSAPLIFPALCVSDALSLGRWWVLAGTMKHNVCVDNTITLKSLFSLPQGQLCPLVLSLMFELEETQHGPGVLIFS